MGNKAFDDFLASIQASIGTLNNSVKVLIKRVNSLSKKAQAGNQQAAVDLAKTETELTNIRETIEELKGFFVTMKKGWSDVANRVIGHVVWSPPIVGLHDTGNYTRDVCVVKLDERKFANWKGNVVDLGAC